MNDLAISPRVISFAIKNGKVLFIKRTGGTFDGMYMPIGGHIDPDEDFVAASDREFVEETGLQPENTKLCGIVHQTGFFGKNVIMFVTTCEVGDGKLIDNEEGKPEWVSISDLNNLKIIKNSIKMLEITISLKPGQIFVMVSKFDGDDKEIENSYKII